MQNSGEERRPYDAGDPANREMFQGIRHGRPGDQKFSLRAFLLMVAIAAVATLVLDFFFPHKDPPPAPPRPAATRTVAPAAPGHGERPPRAAPGDPGAHAPNPADAGP